MSLAEIFSKFEWIVVKVKGGEMHSKKNDVWKDRFPFQKSYFSLTVIYESHRCSVVHLRAVLLKKASVLLYQNIYTKCYTKKSTIAIDIWIYNSVYYRW